jgi:hypothetical protein
MVPFFVSLNRIPSTSYLRLLIDTLSSYLVNSLAKNTGVQKLGDLVTLSSKKELFIFCCFFMLAYYYDDFPDSVVLLIDTRLVKNLKWFYIF